MGFVKKVAKKVANVATGGLYGAYKKKKEEKRVAANQQARVEQEDRLNQELSNQADRHQRQEDANLAALQDKPIGDEMGGILTAPQGLVEDKKLSKKQKLGGGQ